MRREINECLNVLKSARLSFRENREFRRANPDFPVPPYGLAFDAYAHTNWPGYLRHGLEHADLICQKILKYHTGEKRESRRLRILDWGCGPARVVRHVGEKLSPLQSEVYATDYNPRTIRWCRANIPDVRFELNESVPPLPFPNHHFDAIYGISVFTHLSEKQHFAWRDELTRLLAPNGLLIITTHGERFRHHLDGACQARLSQDELVVYEFAREGKRDFQAFHPNKWVRENLLNALECLEHDERELFDWFHQDIWVARSH